MSGSDGQALDYLITEKYTNKPHRGEVLWEVGKLVRRLTQLDWAVGYYNYPFTPARGEFEYPPDIVMLHADIGLVVLNCRNFYIDDIESVSNEDWILSDGTDRPIPEVQEQLAHVQSLISSKRKLIEFQQYADLIPVLALPNVSEPEWSAAGFPDLNATILFKEDLTHENFKSRLLLASEGTDIPDSMFKHARKRINQGDILSADRDPIPEEQLTNTKQSLYRATAWGFDMHEQDKVQEQIGAHIPPGPQQIRGIAGSGKTTIMAKKAAIMHYQYPEWDIALTFNSRALYQTIRKSVDKFYRDLSNGQEPGENLQILHAWGQNPKNTGPDEQPEGMYRKCAIAAGIEPYRMRHTLRGFGSLNTHCADLIAGDEEIPEQYDAILIDEAQDFKPAFYRMCFEALREPKRLIWAYDEAQSLNNLSAPSPKIIFDDDDAEHRSADLSGWYEGGIRKSFVMRQSYRTPRDILMAAHALGMGLYREGDIIHTLTNKDDWDSIGYEVAEGCTFNDIESEIRITRQRELSPHPLQSHVEPGDLFSYSFHDSMEDEAAHIAQQVIADIDEEELDPNNIMVVCTGPKDYNESGIEYARNIRAKRIKEAIDAYGNDVLGVGEYAKVAPEGSRDEFWESGKVTVAGTDRAKGNEAASVYVAGADQISFDNWEDVSAKSGLVWRDNYVQVRNEIVVALTRSEGWCNINAVGGPDDTFLDEIVEVHDVVSQTTPEFVFEAPDPKEMTGEIIVDESVPRRAVREGVVSEFE